MTAPKLTTLHHSAVLMLPTVAHLEELAAFDSTAAVLEAARHRVIAPVEPELRDGRLVLPDQPSRSSAAPTTDSASISWCS